MDVEDLEVYKKLCRLPIDVCDLTHKWPQEEKYELGSQSRRSSNNAPAQLAEKNESFPQAGFPLTPETFMLTPDTK
jgi:four helix bundle protein